MHTIESHLAKRSLPWLNHKPIRTPDLAQSGIYLWVYGRRYAYVGKAQPLRRRLSEHLRFMDGRARQIGTTKHHRHVARKYADEAELFVLELSPEDLQSRETYWIRRVVDAVGSDRCLNYSVDPVKMSRRATRTHKSGTIWTDEFRVRKSAAVKKQWDDPEFRLLNSDRLKKLRDSGWVPTVTSYYDVTTPSGVTYTVPRQFLKTVFGLGTHSSSVADAFATVMLSGWTLGNEQNVGGYSRPETSGQEDAFLRDPDVRRLTALRKKHPRLLTCKPCYTEFRDKVYGALKINDLKDIIKKLNKQRMKEERKLGPLPITYCQSFTEYCRVISGEGEPRSGYKPGK